MIFISLCATLSTDGACAGKPACSGETVLPAVPHHAYEGPAADNGSYDPGLLPLLRADSLFLAGDYFAASIGYERAFYYSEDMHGKTIANLGKVHALKQMGDYQKARDDIQRSLIYTGDRQVRLDVLYEAAFCAHMAGSYRESAMHLQLIAHQFPEGAPQPRVRLLSAMNLLQLDDREGLAAYVQELAGSTGDAAIMEQAERITGALAEKNRPRLRKPEKARLYSTLLPGLGHFYAGEPGKGLLNASSQALALGAATMLLLNGYYVATVTVGLHLFQSFYFGGIRQAGSLATSKSTNRLATYKQNVGEMLIEFQNALAANEANTGSMMPAQHLENTLLALYDFNFYLADSISKSLETNHPGHYLSHFARTHYYWWMIISGSKANDYEGLYRTSISRSLSIARNRPEGNPDPTDLFYLIGIYGMHTRIDIMNKAYVRALRNGRNAMHLVEKTTGMENRYSGFFLTSGLYNYMTVQAGQRYPFLKVYTLFFPEGDRELGLSQLKKAAASDYLIWRTEAHYFLMRIYLEMEELPGLALPHAEWLTRRFPANLIFQYYHLEVLKALGDQGIAQAKAEEIRAAAIRNPNILKEQREYFLSLLEP